MNKPLVSVCIPTYNGEQYLKDCLDSVLAQTFSDFEVLLVDDCSSDETVNIAKEYADCDGRIRVICNSYNLGLVGNWNRCIELAQGEWIKFVFQDDLINPSCLEKMLAASKPESSLICCRRNLLFEDGRIESTQKKFWSIDNLLPGLTEISANDYCNTFLNKMRYDFGAGPIGNFIGEPTAVMLRRSVFYRIGIFNPHLVYQCDFEFWIRVAVNLGITYVPETLATFRLHNKSTTAFNRSEPYRLYRSITLDWLILLHNFAFHPVYAPLREAAANCNPSVNLEDLLAKRAYEARGAALGNSRFLKEWEKIASLYPNFPGFVKRSHTKFATHYLIFRLKRKLIDLSKSIARLIIFLIFKDPSKIKANLLEIRNNLSNFKIRVF